MSGRARRAVSAVVMALGLTGGVMLAGAPIFAAHAAATDDPDGGIVVPINPGEEPSTQITVTVTTTPPPDTSQPVVTMTTTISPDPTVTMTRTVTPKPKPTQTAPEVPQNPPVVPSSAATQPAPSQPENTPTQTDDVVLPPASPSPTPTPSPVPSVTGTDAAIASPTFSEPDPDSVQFEIRNASPEYDELGLSRELAIPGILLVLLIIFAVFLFQGRLQRLAQDAAVRKAGPRSPGRHRGEQAAAPAPYQPYAPVIGILPMQTYVMPQAPQPPAYVDPRTGYPAGYLDYQPYAQQGYAQQAYAPQGYAQQEYRPSSAPAPEPAAQDASAQASLPAAPEAAPPASEAASPADEAAPAEPEPTKWFERPEIPEGQEPLPGLGDADEPLQITEKGTLPDSWYRPGSATESTPGTDEDPPRSS